tara:strand:- start:37 stop:507 length:471 start_codon:yes stop_codon:yes gene_type:complete
MNNYNLYQTENNHYCDCCLKDIDIDNDNYVIGKEQNKGFIFCSEKCNTKEETKIMKKTEIYYRLKFTNKYMDKFATSKDEFVQKNTSISSLVDLKKIVQDMINSYYKRSIGAEVNSFIYQEAIEELSKTKFIKETIKIEYIDNKELTVLNIPEIKN